MIRNSLALLLALAPLLDPLLESSAAYADDSAFSKMVYPNGVPQGARFRVVKTHPEPGLGITFLLYVLDGGKDKAYGPYLSAIDTKLNVSRSVGMVTLGADKPVRGCIEAAKATEDKTEMASFEIKPGLWGVYLSTCRDSVRVYGFHQGQGKGKQGFAPVLWKDGISAKTKKDLRTEFFQFPDPEGNAWIFMRTRRRGTEGNDAAARIDGWSYKEASGRYEPVDEGVARSRFKTVKGDLQAIEQMGR